MTRGDLLANVSMKSGLTITAGHEERAFLERACNAGIREVLLKTHIFVQPGTQALIVGVSDYRLDADTLAVDAAYIAGTSTKFTVVDADTLLSYRAAVGTSPVRLLALLGADLMLVYPTPTSVETITFYYVETPTEIPAGVGSDTITPATQAYGGIPAWAHRAIESYMLWEAGQKDRLGEKALDTLWASFERDCVYVNQFRRKMLGGKLTPAKLGGRRPRAFDERYRST